MSNRLSKMFIVQAETILENAKNLQGRNKKVFSDEGAVAYNYYLDTIDELIKQHNKLVPRINSLLQKEGIEQTLTEIKALNANYDKIKIDRVLYNADQKLVELIFSASTILSFLKEGAILPEITQDKLESIDREINSLIGVVDKNILDNIKESKEEFEKGCFLGSSLISWRVVRSCLQKISGKEIEEKIDELKNYELVREKDGRDFILKANHFSRNLGSHDLEVMPTSSEAISYLGDGIKIARIYTEYKSKSLESIENPTKK